MPDQETASVEIDLPVDLGETLKSLTIDEVTLATDTLSAEQKQRLLKSVGIAWNPRFVRRGVGPIVKARLGNATFGRQASIAAILSERCLQEFMKELGQAYSDPDQESLRQASVLVGERLSPRLVTLTLLSVIQRGAPAARIAAALLSETHHDRGDASGTAVPLEVTDDGVGRESSPAGSATTLAATSEAEPDREAEPESEVEVEAEERSRLGLLPVQRMLDRVERSRVDSDATHYSNLLYLGELLTKLTALSLIACVDPARDETDLVYGAKYRLIRADGLGVWSSVIQELTTAPVYRLLQEGAKNFHVSLTQRYSQDSEAWQRKAMDELRAAAACFPTLGSERDYGKVSAAQWFQQFTALRNKTRGHGADLITWQADAALHLRASLDALLQGLQFLSWDWWLVSKTGAGASRVHVLAGEREPTKEVDAGTLAPGIYAFPGREPRLVELLRTDADLSDFLLPNGDAQDAKLRYEQLSYISGQKVWGQLHAFTRVPRRLPASETEGSTELRVFGNVLTNLPEQQGDYVRRQQLEGDLAEVLLDARHPVVAINGPGGIGKTSLALQVLHDFTESEAFSAILWFSARDVDLDPLAGPKPVRPRVQSLTQIARQYASLVEPMRLDASPESLEQFFLNSLADNANGPMLFVFDNFETVQNPVELYRHLNSFVGLPNKILVTTRYREFKGDWPLEVGGMSRVEFDTLLNTSASRLGVTGLLQSKKGWVDSLFRESGGHPYVVKVALGEVARTRKVGQRFDRIMASREDILDALFERSFNRLSPDAQRVFFTLCRWRALVPSAALEAVLTRPANPRFDVEESLRSLLDSSLVERFFSDVDYESYLHVPAAAYKFGMAQLKFSELHEAVEEDARFLHYFGAVSDAVLNSGFAGHIHRYFDVIRGLEGVDREQALAVGEYLARRYPEAWLWLADVQMEGNPQGRLAAKGSYQSYLSRHPDDADAWLKLAELCGKTSDSLGELRAFAEAAGNADRSYAPLSAAIAGLRERLDAGALRVDSKLKRDYLLAISQGWKSRSRQASAHDCFNLARLAERGGDLEEALYWSDEGARRDRRDQRFSDMQARLGSLLRGTHR